jgi:hypothetical protein
MMEAIFSSDTSVLTRATRRNVPEDGILHSLRCESFKSHRAAYSLLVGKPEIKRPLGRRRRVANIKVDLGGMGGVLWYGLDWSA